MLSHSSSPPPPGLGFQTIPTEAPPPPPTTTGMFTESTTTTTTTVATARSTTQQLFDAHSSLGRGFVEEYVVDFSSPYPERAENDLIFGRLILLLLLLLLLVPLRLLKILLILKQSSHQGILTSVGYFLITIVLMIGVVMGDRQKYTVSQNVLGTCLCFYDWFSFFNFFLLIFQSN